MTGHLEALRTSESVRDLSRRAFNSSMRVELCLLIEELGETFIFDELFERAVALAERCNVEGPSQSNVRKELERLRKDFGALERLPRVKGSLIKREVRRESAVWNLCRELHARGLGSRAGDRVS